MFENFSEKDLAVLAERAHQIARNKAQIDDNSTMSMLRCVVGDEWYAIPLQDMTTIYRGATVVPVPGTPNFFRGIANLRGRIVPVLGLDVLLGGTVPVKGNELIVVTHEDDMVALQVDRVDNVVVYTDADLEPVPEDMQTSKVAACLSDGTLILNVGELLSEPTLVINV